MGLGVDVGIDAQRDRRTLAQAAGDVVERLQFGGRFDVEAEDAGSQRGAHFLARLADAREHDLGRIAAGRQHAGQFAAGDDVEAGAEAGEDVEDARGWSWP